MNRREFAKKSALTGAVMAMGGLFSGWACKVSDWISVALADLPVVLQMALNIAGLVGALGGHVLTEAETAAVNEISAEAAKGLTLIQTLYNEYKANPSQDTLGKIEAAIAELNEHLPELLKAAHISNAILASRIAAAVSLILTTVTGFASLIPQPTNAKVRQMKAANRGTHVDNPKALKAAWNAQVCGPTGDVPLDYALGKVVMQ